MIEPDQCYDCEQRRAKKPKAPTIEPWARIGELEAENARLTDALTKYASSLNWADGDDEGVRRFWARRDDGRSLARAALRWPITEDEMPADNRTETTGRGDTVHPVCPNGCGATYVRLDEHICRNGGKSHG